MAERWAPGSAEETCLLAGTMAIIAYYLIGEISGLYRSWRGISTELEVICVLATWAFTLPILLSLAYFSGHLNDLPRNLLLAWILVVPLMMAVNRGILRYLQRVLRIRGLNLRSYAIVGVNDLGFQLARNIEHCAEMGLQLVGFYDDRPLSRLPRIPGDLKPRVGNIDQLIEDARRHHVDMIYIAFPMRAEQRIKNVLDRLGDTTASVYIVPDFFVFELLHSCWTSISGLPVVSVFENPFYGVDGMVKRGIDVVLASLFLLIAFLPMLLIALAVKLSSPGPVFFRQRRYGLDGREILVYKFRTMRVCEDGPQVPQATRNDPRVTRVGAFLRRTSLDELPQLFNVLQGNMSLVGPRPHASVHNETFRKMIPGYMLRHKVKPGITGLAQVSGWRGETDTLGKMEKRIECDHRYIREWSLWMDIKILFLTAFVVLSRQNAY
jgi:putative colanic acid biosynthesis UDP-glucose lipid carrier transferase